MPLLNVVYHHKGRWHLDAQAAFRRAGYTRCRIEPVRLSPQTEAFALQTRTES